MSGLCLTFNREDCIKLIKLYGSFKRLWDPRDPEYTMRISRDDAWKSISREMGAPVFDLKKKIDSLLGTYRRERSRERQSRIMGLAGEDLYNSKWYAYEHFQFMADKHNAGDTQDVSLNVKDTKQDDDSGPDREGHQQPTPVNSKTQTQNEKPLLPSRKKQKRKANDVDEEEDDRLNEAFKLLKECVETSVDPYYMYGQHIANELRKYDQITLSHVKNAINNIIFEADIGRLPQCKTAQSMESNTEGRMERWAGRVAVVTGANSGIGAEIVKKLVKHGLKVVGIGLTTENIEKTSQLLKSEKGELHAVTCDITKQEQVKEAFEWVKNKLGGPDILINCAAVCGPNSVIDGPVEEWQAIMNTNVIGLSMCNKEAVQSMLERGVDDGHIININSRAGHRMPPTPRDVMYYASKHGVTVLSEGLRMELLHRNSKIRVTSISPGLVKTTLPSADYFETCPYVQPEDIADGVIYAIGTPPHVQVHELSITPVQAIL